MPPSTFRRSFEWLLIVLFMAAISLPLVGKLLPTSGSFALTENRHPAPFPTIRLGQPGWGYSIASFPRRFERFWNDSFAFRWYLIRAHSLAKLALGASPSPKVILGNDGYLYYAGQRSLDYFRGTHPFTPSELASLKADFERRQKWLAERGVRYLVVVAPNKESIYPEHMPPAMTPVAQERRLDQMLGYLRQHGDVDVLDLRPALRAAKERQRVYHITDTHWNDAGALVAAEVIFQRLSSWYPDLEPRRPDGVIATRVGPGGDLARLLALEDLFPEEYLEWKPAAPSRARLAPVPANLEDVTIHACPTCAGPVVVMTEDSFNTNLAPLLAEQFRELIRVPGFRLAQPFIEERKPQLVIEQFVERKLMCFGADC